MTGDTEQETEVLPSVGGGVGSGGAPLVVGVAAQDPRAASAQVTREFGASWETSILVANDTATGLFPTTSSTPSSWPRVSRSGRREGPEPGPVDGAAG